MGLAHGRCNMQARVKKNELVIVVHNFKSYDSKLIIEALNNHELIKDIEVITTNSEKFNCVSEKQIWPNPSIHQLHVFLPFKLGDAGRGLAARGF